MARRPMALGPCAFGILARERERNRRRLRRTSGKGYDLLFAREDEYERGGGRFTYRGNTGLLSAGFVPLPEISSPRAPLPDGFERIDVGAIHSAPPTVD